MSLVATPVAQMAMAVAALTVLALSAWAFGETLLRRLWPASARRERVPLATSLGLGVVALGIFVLGAAGLLRPGGLLAPLAVGHVLCRRAWTRLWADRRKALGIVRRHRAALAGLGAGLLPTALLGLYPPTAFDALAYHLPFVRAFVEAGRWVWLPDLRFPIFPIVGESHFVFVDLLGGGAEAAQLSQLLAAALVAALLVEWGRLAEVPRAGWWAAALWLGTPLVVFLASSAYVDTELALFVTAAAVCCQRWRHQRGPWLVLAASFAGLAAGTKYLGLFFVAALMLVVFADGGRRRWRRAAIFAVFAAAAAAPWYGRIVLATGNPVFPFYEAIFGDNEWSQPQRPPETEGNALVEAVEFALSTPWRAVFDRQAFHFRPPLSPWHVVLIPLGLVLAWRAPPARPWLGVALAYALFWLTTVRDLRFLIPILPMVHLSLGLGGARLLPPRRELTAGLAVLLLLPGPIYAIHRLIERGPPPLTEAARHGFLGRELAGYDGLRRLDELEGRDAAVYVLYGENLRYHASGRFLGDWYGPYRYARVLAARTDGEALATELRAMGADYLLVLDTRGQVRLPGDASFARRFEPVDQAPVYRLFRLRGGLLDVTEPP